MQPQLGRLVGLFLGPWFDLGKRTSRSLQNFAFGQAAARKVLAVPNLCAPVGPGEDRPVPRLSRVVDAVRYPHVEVLPLADEAAVGHSLARIAGVIDRPLKRDREIQGPQLLELVLFRPADLDGCVVPLRLAVVLGGRRSI